VTHPSTKALLSYFTYDHLPEGSPMRDTSAILCDVAHTMVGRLPENPETSAGLRKLLEAKDCFVRASLNR
jgi:hypothetical protein